MANTKSAEKRIRQAEKRSARNRVHRTHLRTYVRRIRELIVAGKKEDAQAGFVTLQSVLARIAQKGIIHPKKSARLISRFSAKIKAM